MQLDLQNTIVAVSSGIAPAQRAVVRISGPDTRAILDQLLVASSDSEGSLKSALLESRVARSSVHRCSLGFREATIAARIYYWPDERCYTGEASAEIHLLGALPLVERIVQRVIALGAVPAGKGEFTLRSFLAGKIDLTQAEAVLAVIEAGDDQQLVQALEQLGGNISKPVRRLRDQLLELIAHLEAGLDFVEEDIEFISQSLLESQVASIQRSLQSIDEQLNLRGVSNRQPHVVLVGLPNAGKSSLFNALLGRPRVIVSPIAGTTRDIVAENMNVEGLQIELVDTAGIEQLPNGLSSTAQKHALDAASAPRFDIHSANAATPGEMAQAMLLSQLQRADLLLYCVDLSAPLFPETDAEQVAWIRELVERPILLVGTKADRASEMTPPPLSGLSAYCPTSVSDGHTIDELKCAIRDLLANNPRELQTDAMHRTLVRCQQGIRAAMHALARAQELSHSLSGEELVAAELRIALDDLSGVIGDVHTEDILGKIFSRFCIGK
ncbi:MAG: 50S ribosome-binding GTPase [Planctomycetales bacterium]|nr:50S ribosome-binding GTPase [Planctomycetales bacterium]